MCLKRDWVHKDESKSTLPTIFGCRFIKALITSFNWLLAAKRYFCTIELSELRSSGQTVGLRYFGNDSFGLIFFLLASLSSCSILFKNPFAVLSFKARNCLWDFLTVAVALYSDAYFPIVYWSLSFHLM